MKSILNFILVIISSYLSTVFIVDFELECRHFILSRFVHLPPSMRHSMLFLTYEDLTIRRLDHTITMPYIVNILCFLNETIKKLVSAWAIFYILWEASFDNFTILRDYFALTSHVPLLGHVYEDTYFSLLTVFIGSYPSKSIFSDQKSMMICFFTINWQTLFVWLKCDKLCK